MSAFHFLRPEFLFLLLPAGLLVWWLLKQQNDESKWQKIINPKLLKHLLVENEGSNGKGQAQSFINAHAKIPAAWHLAAVLTVLIVALSGPSWKLKESPFTKDDTKIAFLMHVGKSMLTTDIMPSRLSRATMKIEDLLKSRSDTQSMLFAYSGTAHLVLPLTSDHSIIKTFAQALDPGIMPMDGNNIQDALVLAQTKLNSKGSTIIVLTDAISASSMKLADKNGFDDSTNVIFWQMASTQLSSEVDFKSAASVLNAEYVKYAGDNSDVEAVSSLIEKNFKNAAQDDNSKYEDGGYTLVPLLFLLLLLWARQGFIAELWRRA